jgi:hypothetical protein
MKYAISYLIHRSITAHRHHIAVTVTDGSFSQFYSMAHALGIFVVE